MAPHWKALTAAAVLLRSAASKLDEAAEASRAASDAQAERLLIEASALVEVAVARAGLGLDGI